MTSVLHSTFDPPRPQSHQGIHSSPVASPHIPRPASQASLHLAPAANGGYSPLIDQGSPHPFTAFTLAHSQPFKPFPSNPISLPSPHTAFNGGQFPNSAPPIPFYQGSTPLFDVRTSQPMIRTVSHAHPMQSATEATASSRYSSSPHLTSHEAPPTAGFPSFNFSDAEERHVNPAIFNSYSMSRSTSGASDPADYNNPRLLTPNYEGSMNSHEAELRKVSDTLGRLPSSRYYNHNVSPHLDMASPHLGANGFAPHPQPNMGLYANPSRGWGNDFATSAERGKLDVLGYNGETDYERERAQQILNNKKLLEEVGLGGDGQYMRSRNVSSSGNERARKGPVTPVKRRVSSGTPVRASPRIASQYRNVSYANLDGGQIEEESEEEYQSEQEGDDDGDEDEFRLPKRAKGMRRGVGGRKASRSNKNSRRGELSLYGLLQVYPEIPHLFPLFYYTLNNDLTINSESVPLIGSIPSTVTPIEKAEMLRGFFHRSRRVLAQLDAFTARCDRKYDGPEARFPELDHHTRIAIRDIRRKVVERCENYKYTRRDLLDKNVGKNKWQPIEQGIIEWRVGMTQNDPAGDLAHVTLTLPTPPPGQYPQHRAPTAYPGRQVKPLPSRRSSAMPQSARSFSVTMAEPDGFTPTTAPMMNYSYDSAPPMYGEDQVAMTVTMPLSSNSMGATTGTSPLTALTHHTPMDATLISGHWENKNLKRDRSSEDEASDQEELHTQTLWQ